MSEHRYASGEEPMIRDIVERVDERGGHSHIKPNELLVVTSIEAPVEGLSSERLINHALYPCRFRLIARSAKPEHFSAAEPSPYNGANAVSSDTNPTVDWSSDHPKQNTDREIWHDRDDHGYGPSIFVTQGGAIGINVGGTAIVAPVQAWHSSASDAGNLRAEIESLKNDVASLGILKGDAERNYHEAASKLSAARAEIERLTKERDVIANQLECEKANSEHRWKLSKKYAKCVGKIREGLGEDARRFPSCELPEFAESLRNERDELRAKLAESEAAAAKMREALQWCSDAFADKTIVNGPKNGEGKRWAIAVASNVAIALKENIGRDFLAERDKMQTENAKLREENEYLATDLTNLRSELAKSIDQIDTIGQRLTLPPQSTVERILEEIEYVRERARGSKVMLISDEQNYDAFVQSRKAQPNLLPSQTDTDLLHGVIGIVTEAGELLDALKKQHFYGRELNRTNVIEELGDLEFYLSLCRNTLGVSRKEVIEANVRKLELRYKERFTREESENRDLKAEAEAIESHRRGESITTEEYRKQLADLKLADALAELEEAAKRNGTLEELREADCTRLLAYDAELQRQLNEAWMRVDYATADRIADLLGVPKPSDHEKEDLQPAAEWPEVYETKDGRTITFASKDDTPRSQGRRRPGCNWRYSEAETLVQLGGWKLVSKGGKPVKEVE